MSWTASLPEPLAAPEVYDAIDALVPQGQTIGEAVAAADQAKLAAKALIESGALGTGCEFRVGLSGHANPGNAPVAGWANDFVQISITQN